VDLRGVSEEQESSGVGFDDGWCIYLTNGSSQPSKFYLMPKTKCIFMGRTQTCLNIVHCLMFFIFFFYNLKHPSKVIYK
jgi:hypothetical protein